MAEIRYGMRVGKGTGQEYRVAADQYMHRRGGHFVYLSNGDVTMCASNSTKVLGWAEPPKDADGYSSWKSSATGRADKVFVITELDAIFEMPYDASATTLTASYIGTQITVAESGATYSQIQEASSEPLT